MSRSPITKSALAFIAGIVVFGYVAFFITSSLWVIANADRVVLKALSDAAPEDITAVSTWLEKHRDAVICLDGKPKNTPIAISISKPGRPIHRIDCIEALIAASSDPIDAEVRGGATGGVGDLTHSPAGLGALKVHP